ncbi:A-kinase anchor protein 17A [Nymphon striatum]|nr:A-kinase anchor protein 17A [Nymphon striatum]
MSSSQFPEKFNESLLICQQDENKCLNLAAIAKVYGFAYLVPEAIDVYLNIIEKKGLLTENMNKIVKIIYCVIDLLISNDMNNEYLMKYAQKLLNLASSCSQQYPQAEDAKRARENMDICEICMSLLDLLPSAGQVCKEQMQSFNYGLDRISSSRVMALDLTTRCPRATCQTRHMSKGLTPYQVVMDLSLSIMTNVQICNDPSDVTPLYGPLGLHLKPVAKINITVQLPQMRSAGKSISNGEVTNKIKNIIKPFTFTSLKVVKSTLDFIRFEAEAENKAAMKSMLSKLETKNIKLSGFAELLKLKAAEAKSQFPTRHDWDSYFRDAKHMNEMEPGERPDTIHFQGLPSKWFSDSNYQNQNQNYKDDDKPSENILKKVCETFGKISHVDIPMLDPYRCEMNPKTLSGSIQTFSFGQDLTFEAFVQYEAYIGFANAMDTMRGMKLMYKDENEKSFTANIKVDFDKTKHLSQKSIAKRERDREKLKQLEQEREERVIKEREAEERKKGERKKQEEELKEKERRKMEKLMKQEERQKLREEKRRRKKIEKKQIEEIEKQEKAIALEERKVLLARRKLESIRLLNHLFFRVKRIKVKNDLKEKEKELELERIKQLQRMQELMEEEKRQKEIEDKRVSQRLEQTEELLKLKLLKKLEMRQEKQKEDGREERRKESSTKRSKLKSVLVIAPVVSDGAGADGSKM